MTEPALPAIGEDPWGTTLNDYLTWLKNDTSVVQDVVEEALSRHTPGARLAFAEVTGALYSTATSFAAASAMAGLSCTVVGTGRPVDVEFYSPSVLHTVADALVFVSMVEGGASNAKSQRLQTKTPAVASGKGMSVYMKKSMTLTDGVSYTFTARMYSDGVAGTMESYGFANVQSQFMQVTAR